MFHPRPRWSDFDRIRDPRACRRRGRHRRQERRCAGRPLERRRGHRQATAPGRRGRHGRRHCPVHPRRLVGPRHAGPDFVGLAAGAGAAEAVFAAAQQPEEHPERRLCRAIAASAPASA